ncbi:MAG: hypothetical protein AAF127_11910 [Pseudomonadota bacterium]
MEALAIEYALKGSASRGSEPSQPAIADPRIAESKIKRVFMPLWLIPLAHRATIFSRVISQIG